MSRLCHDLVSPVGAVVNGMELLEEMGGEVGDEATVLVTKSAKQASSRLQFFRVAYGFAGGRSDRTFEEGHDLIEGYFGGGKVTIEWAAAPSLAGKRPHRNAMKLILGMCQHVVEGLPRGGHVLAAMAPIDGRLEVRVSGEGTGARLDPLVRQAWEKEAETEALDTRTVTAYVMGRLAETSGIDIVIDESQDRIEFAASLPPIQSEE